MGSKSTKSLEILLLIGMTINNKGVEYNLHEFLGEEEVKEELRLLYRIFFAKSKPLSFKTKTLSDLQRETEKHFNYLIENTKIFYARKEYKMIFFIAFDFERKSQTYSIQTAHLAKLNACEFVFAASNYNNIFEMKRAAYDIFQFLKEKYGFQFIIGNINRERKKDKFIKTTIRIFNFRILDGDIALYEVP